MNSAALTIGQTIRYTGTGRLANRTSPAAVIAVDKRDVTVETPSGNVMTLDISRIRIA